eukprot:5373282-Amphidinium_carterae.1
MEKTYVPEVDSRAFPWLMPTGEGGLPALTLPDRERLAEVWLKRNITGSLGAGVRRTSLKQQVFTVLRSVPGTAPFIYAKRSMALRFIATLGKP